MSQHESLRRRTNQQKPKNVYSKFDDKDISKAMLKLTDYLLKKKEFQTFFSSDWELDFAKKIEIKYMIDFIKKQNIRAEFNTEFIDRSIVPDGGILYLVNKKNGEKYPLVIAEIKRQGSNDEREAEGKSKQATGNAIERLGKNLVGIRTMMNYESVTPFVCFGWGCDFELDSDETKTVRAKVVMMNEFYNLNQIYIFKKDGNIGKNSFAPVSMFFRKEKWTVDEMYTIMKEIAETTIRYYLY